MPSKKLRVGFDLDGVLLYNPARIARPLVTFFKQRILRSKKTTFFVPTNRVDQWIWKMLHYSSLFTAPGLNDIKQLVRNGKIEAFIVTGRYGFLIDDFEKWLKKINASEFVTRAIINKNSEQPHLFKLRTVRDLNLDIYVEDNWDIVKKLSEQSEKGKKLKVFWIYNIFDRFIPYQFKYPTLQKAVDSIKTLV